MADHPLAVDQAAVGQVLIGIIGIKISHSGKTSEKILTEGLGGDSVMDESLLDWKGIEVSAQQILSSSLILGI